MPIDDWASDANFPAGSDPWSSQPTKDEPIAGVKATGFRPGRKLPAQWLNWLFGTIIESINGLEVALGLVALGVATSVDNEIPRFHSTGGKTLQNSGLLIDDSNELAYATPKARSAILSLSDAMCLDGGTGAPATITAAFSGIPSMDEISVPAASHTYFPVRLRSGCVITSVDVTADPGTSFTARLLRVAPSFASSVAATTSIGSVSNSGTSIQTRTISALSETVDNSTNYYFVQLEATAGALVIHGIRVNYNDPGPRNN
jgi:hypothetical protein